MDLGRCDTRPASRRLGIVSHALNNIGYRQTGASDESGWPIWSRALRLPWSTILPSRAARAFTNIASRRVNARDHARAAPIFDQASPFASAWILIFRACTYTFCARSRGSDRGEWNASSRRGSIARTDGPASDIADSCARRCGTVKIRARTTQELLHCWNRHSSWLEDTGEIQRLGRLPQPRPKHMARTSSPGIRPPACRGAGCCCCESWRALVLGPVCVLGPGVPSEVSIAPRAADTLRLSIYRAIRAARGGLGGTRLSLRAGIALLGPALFAGDERRTRRWWRNLEQTPLIQRVRRRLARERRQARSAPTPSSNGNLTAAARLRSWSC